jgi:hypothetical protein
MRGIQWRGYYQRTVRSVDDLILRYVWREDG